MGRVPMPGRASPISHRALSTVASARPSPAYFSRYSSATMLKVLAAAALVILAGFAYTAGSRPLASSFFVSICRSRAAAKPTSG